MVLWIILVAFSFQLQGYYLLWRSFPTLFIYDIASMLYVRNPNEVNFIGLACSAFARRYLRNRISFSSSGYLDVSVPRVCLLISYEFRYGYHSITSGGFPHSEISGSKLAYSSPKHIGVRPVLHRLLVPRHPPCALLHLTILCFHALRWFLMSCHQSSSSSLTVAFTS